MINISISLVTNEKKLFRINLDSTKTNVHFFDVNNDDYWFTFSIDDWKDLSKFINDQINNQNDYTL